MSASGRDEFPSSPVLLEEAYEQAYGVFDDMSEMRLRLGDAGLEHVIPFNDVYRELSGEVAVAILRGEFRLPLVVARTMPIFYDYYDRAVSAHEAGEYDLVSAPWQQSFYDRRTKKALPGIQFLLGMNTHINTDLAQATNDSRVGDDYYYDYRKVIGKLIQRTARRLSGEYIPGPSAFRALLTSVTVASIAHAREKAWKEGKRLQAAESDVATRGIVRKLETHSVRKGEQLLTLGNFAVNRLAQVAA